MYAHVEHYLHLRSQGLPHLRAMAHTKQRFGITEQSLLVSLSKAYEYHRDQANVLEGAHLIVAIGADEPTEQMDTI